MANQKASVNKNEKLTTSQQHDKYRQAGKIAQEVKKKTREIVKLGVRVIDICETIEKEVTNLGGKWAFPCNVSINEVAAHYTSPMNDESVIEKGDVVKVDFGVHIDGFIADTAYTVSFNSTYSDLGKASEDALKTALDIIKPGVRTHVIGKAVEETINGFGYKSIRELSGHLLDEYHLHGGKTIPNISLPSGPAIVKDEVYAVETFASSGIGSVHDRPYAYIYRLLPTRARVRFQGSRQLISYVSRNFKTLPFATRWLSSQLTPSSLRLALRELSQKGVLHSYNVLADVQGSYVGQTEHTIIVTKDGAEITT